MNKIWLWLRRIACWMLRRKQSRPARPAIMQIDFDVREVSCCGSAMRRYVPGQQIIKTNLPPSAFLMEGLRRYLKKGRDKSPLYKPGDPTYDGWMDGWLDDETLAIIPDEYVGMGRKKNQKRQS